MVAKYKVVLRRASSKEEEEFWKNKDKRDKKLYRVVGNRLYELEMGGDLSDLNSNSRAYAMAQDLADRLVSDSWGAPSKVTVSFSVER